MTHFLSSRVDLLAFSGDGATSEAIVLRPLLNPVTNGVDFRLGSSE
jgi:hypothetical protein